MPVGHFRWATARIFGQMREIGRLLKRRIDQNEPAPLRRRNVSSRSRPAVDPQRLGTPVAPQGCRKRPGRPRFEFAGDQTILRTQETLGDQRGAGIGAQLATGVQRRHHVEVRLDQVVHRPGFARSPNPLDALMPFAAAGCFGAAQVIAARSGVGIDDAKGRGLEPQMQKHAHENAVFVHIGKIAGMKSVAIIHQPPKDTIRNGPPGIRPGMLQAF